MLLLIVVVVIIIIKSLLVSNPLKSKLLIGGLGVSLVCGWDIHTYI